MDYTLEGATHQIGMIDARTKTITVMCGRTVLFGDGSACDDTPAPNAPVCLACMTEASRRLARYQEEVAR